MYKPSIEEFRRLARSANMIPVYREVFADALSPVLAFRALGAPRRGAEEPYAFLLESVEGQARVGRYSFIGVRPFLVFKGWLDGVETVRNGVSARRQGVNPFGALAEILARYRPAPVGELPRFSGGAVGYIGYDAVRLVEPLPAMPPDELGLPVFYLAFYDTLLIFDRVWNTLKVVAYAYTEGLWPEEAYAAAVRRIDETLERLAAVQAEAPLDVPADAPPGPFRSNIGPEEYRRKVEKAKEYIRAGDIVQVVPSQCLRTSTSAPPFDIYRTLRYLNPSPYMFYLAYPEVKLIGSSPEVMLRVEGRRLTVRPIAGTRPRGRSPEEDEALARELLSDPKERAEHIMLVDLGRNDLGRVSVPGSVEVTELMVIERYSHVMHIVSNVQGLLKPGLSAIDALQSALPAGTVSGAPKVRAMQIIDELEPTARGPYAGAVGYFDFFGNMDTCIAIRTVVYRDGDCRVQAGGGVVADSDPEREYQETLNKAQALLRAIRMAEGAGGEGK